MPKPITPKHLSDSAQGWWERITTEYSLSDSASLLVLQASLEAYDRATEARELIDAEGAVVRDRFDQPKPHPAAAIERDNRSALIQGLKSLGLHEELS